MRSESALDAGGPGAGLGTAGTANRRSRKRGGLGEGTWDDKVWAELVSKPRSQTQVHLPKREP